MTNQNFTKLLDSLINDADNADFDAVYGLRVHHEHCKPGDKLDNSYTWIDGEQTDEELEGVCTIGIPSIDVEGLSSAIKNLGRSACSYFDVDSNKWHDYWGECFVLVRGDYDMCGDDVGERIIVNPVVVAVFEI